MNYSYMHNMDKSHKHKLGQKKPDTNGGYLWAG